MLCCSPRPDRPDPRSISEVSDTPFFGGGDFLRSMLGDLVRMMPTGTGLQWQLAYQLAAQIASGGAPDANPDPIERIRFEELCAIAELHVAEVTGMPISPSGGSVRSSPSAELSGPGASSTCGARFSTGWWQCWLLTTPARPAAGRRASAATCRPGGTTGPTGPAGPAANRASAIWAAWPRRDDRRDGGAARSVGGCDVSGDDGLAGWVGRRPPLRARTWPIRRPAGAVAK